MSRSDVVYYYDGSFYGFLSGVFDAFAQKEEPMLFLSQEEEEQPLLFDSHFVETDPQKARRVLRGVQRTLGSRGVNIVREGFLTRLPQREYLLLKFLRQGFREGPRILAPVSYTHLDVYKRQAPRPACFRRNSRRCTGLPRRR